MKKKIVYILGGNGLIGKHIVQKMDNKKNLLIILDNNVRKKEKKKNIIQEYFDISNLFKIEDKLKKLSKKYGVPDIFINASYPRTGNWGKISFSNISILDIKKNLNLHLCSYTWTLIIIAGIMRKSKKTGSIVILNSIYGILGQDKNIYKGLKMNLNPIYSIIKGGLISLVRNAASEFGDCNIRINSVISGGVKGHIASRKKRQPKKFIQRYSNKTFLKRMADPNEIADTVCYLANDNSTYITGQSLVVDGGYTAN